MRYIFTTISKQIYEDNFAKSDDFKNFLKN